MTFGKELKKMRKQHGDTLRSLAEKVKVSHSYIQRIENEDQRISSNCLEKLLAAYPKEKHKLIALYLQESLPESIQSELGIDSGFALLNVMKTLLADLDLEAKKVIYRLILEKAEINSIKNGSYVDIHDDLEAWKKEVESL